MAMTRNETRAAAAVVMQVLLALGCEQLEAIDWHNLGNTEAPETENSASARLAPVPIASETYSDFVGTWVGVAEDVFGAPDANGQFPVYHFPSGSSEIRLVLPPRDALIDPAAPDLPGGMKLTFGQSAPVDWSETDPIRLYPPEFLEGAYYGNASFPPLEGFEYTLRGGTFSIDERNYQRDLSPEAAESYVGMPPDLLGDRLGLFMENEEVFRPWCAQQTAESCSYGPVASGLAADGTWTCYEQTADLSVCDAADFGDAFRDCYERVVAASPDRRVDCPHAYLCSERCACTESGCYAKSLGYIPQLDLHRMSDGSLLAMFQDLVVLNDEGYRRHLGTVRFTRVAP